MYVVLRENISASYLLRMYCQWEKYPIEPTIDQEYNGK